MLEKTQPQRLRDELILILKEEHPLKQLKRIKGLTGFKFVNPGLSLSQKTTELLKSIQGRIDWFRKNYPRRRQLDTWLIYLIGLLEPLDINKIRSVCKRFAFRRGEEKRILNYKKMSRKIIQELSRMKIKPSKIFTLLEPLSYEVIILIKAKSRNIRLQKHIEIFFEIYNGMRPYICGEDLRKFGIAPSPFYQKVFTKVLEAKLNGLVKTKEEELLLIKKLIRA